MKQFLSITDITSYMYCPRKFYLKKIGGLKEKMNRAMIQGKLKHEIFDTFNRNEKNIVTSITNDINKDEILKLYRTEAIKITNQTINFNKEVLFRFKISNFDFLNEVLSKLEREIALKAESVSEGIKNGKFGDDLWENLSPKYLSEVEIVSENLALRGRIDRLEIGEKIIPYEIKTRSDIYESDKIQLAGYALLLEEKFNKIIEEGYVETETEKIEIKIDKKLKDKFLELAEEIRTMLREKKEIPISSNFKKCQSCKFQDMCFSE
jgi:CRISPR-associated protein Cas4